MTKTIGIRREDKNQWERRVPVTPADARELSSGGEMKFVVQPSKIRVFKDDEYEAAGARISEDLSSCDIVLGVKEMPPRIFRKGALYVFFAHVIKGQSYNMPMLKALLDAGACLLDYEKITDDKGRRLVFFGRHAGLAGMIDTLWALGARLKAEGVDNPFARIRKSHEYDDLASAIADVAAAGDEIRRNGLPQSMVPMVVGFTGYGNVSGGAQEILRLLPVAEVDPSHIPIAGEGSARSVYKVVFREEHMVEPIAPGAAFSLQDYYRNPQNYRSIFEKYIQRLTVIVNAIYWDAKYPRFVTRDALSAVYLSSDPKLKVIGDLSCDINGSVEATLRTTDSGNPVFVYDTVTGKARDGVKGNGPVILAVDNLPAEIPRESSEYFSGILKPFIAAMAKADLGKEDTGLPPELTRALIARAGKLTPAFAYIEKHIEKASSMKKILVLGAGFVARPLVRYLLDDGRFRVQVADLVRTKAEELVAGHHSGECFAADISSNPAGVEALVRGVDVVVSLLPAPLHPTVARMCLAHGKHMVTTSYVSPAMRALDAEARAKGLMFVNEVGVDPGIDHMSAMRVIHAVKERGGKVTSFRSYCGGLPAPEANTNPIGYKFSWSPRGVLVAATNAARYIDRGMLVEIPGPELFANFHIIEVEGAGRFEAYANRDSTGYMATYGLENMKNMYRGTLRNRGHCDTWLRWVRLGLFDQSERSDLSGKTYSELMRMISGAPGPDGAAKAMGVRTNHPAVRKLEWLGLFSNEMIPSGTPTVLDALSARMQAMMGYAAGERDMLVMAHRFTAEYPDGRVENISSDLVDFGVPGGDTSMARTVGLPAAIATRMVAEGSLNLTGVIVPVMPELYRPVLDELEKLDIAFRETVEQGRRQNV